MNNKPVCKFCGEIAEYQFKDGSFCCSPKWQSCPFQRRKFGDSQRGENNPRFKREPWNKGLTKEDPRVLHYSEKCKETKKQNPKPAWNKGLTKEDPRVAQYVEKISASKKGRPNYKKRIPISESQTKCKAYFHYRFKQGLYTHWVYPILERDNFHCVICKQKSEPLEVHHLKSYGEIFQECLEKLNLNIKNWQSWNNIEIESLHNLILKSHSLDMGISVCTACHGKIDKHRQKFLQKGKESDPN